MYFISSFKVERKLGNKVKKSNLRRDVTKLCFTARLGMETKMKLRLHLGGKAFFS